MKKLPQDLVSLIYHAELHEEGWWKKNIRKLILAILWKEHCPLLSGTISSKLHTDLEIQISAEDVDRHLQSLLQEKSVIRDNTNSFKITEQCFSAFNEQVERGIQLEKKAHDYFYSCLLENGIELNDPDLWSGFHDQYLVPTVNALGVTIFELLTSTDIEDGEWKVDEYLESVSSIDKVKLRSAVAAFLSSKQDETRNYILRLLSSCFLLKAANIDESVIKELERKKKSELQISLFLDTNFLFSFLGLHRNPGDDSVVALRNLLKEVAKRITVRLFVLDKTLQEFQRVCVSASQALRGVPIPPNIAQAAIEQKISGIAAKYFESVQAAGSRISPDDYFRPYIEDFHEILAQHGIEVFRVQQTSIQDQSLVNDLNDQLSREEQVSEDKRKSYEKLSHDLTLWHEVNKRRRNITSPLDADDWVVTLDYWLLGFDEFKIRNNKGQIRVCLLPASLIQLLRFWTPKSEQLDSALIGALKLPVLLGEFDYEDEAATFKISSALSRFEHADDLDIDTVRSIMANRVIRARISQPIEAIEEVELIRNGILNHNRSLSDRLRETESKTSKQLQQIEIQKQRLTELGEQADALDKVNSRQAARSASLEKELADKDTQLANERESKAFYNSCVWPWLITAPLLTLLLLNLQEVAGKNLIKLFVITLFLFVWSWSEWVTRYCTKHEVKNQPRIFSIAKALRYGGRTLGGAAIITFLVWILGSWLNPLWPWKT